MSFTIEQARATHEALVTASKAEGLPRQIRDELAERGDEWRRAADWAQDVADSDSGHEATIEMVSSVHRGARVFHDRHGFCLVLRRINDGLSLQMESPDDPRGWWRNFMDTTSPVVIRA